MCLESGEVLLRAATGELSALISDNRPHRCVPEPFHHLKMCRLPISFFVIRRLFRVFIVNVVPLSSLLFTVFVYFLCAGVKREKLILGVCGDQWTDRKESS